jgi:nitrogen regulatory protein PII
MILTLVLDSKLDPKSKERDMKKIEAIIRSSKFDHVKEALSGIGINFFTFMEVKGYGKQKGDHVMYRGAPYDVGYIARLSLEIFVPDDKVQEVVATVRNAARTGEIGDGKIIVIPVDQLVSIRTGFEDESAI